MHNNGLHVRYNFCTFLYSPLQNSNVAQGTRTTEANFSYFKLELNGVVAYLAHEQVSTSELNRSSELRTYVLQVIN